jgi:Na+/H+-translocating membrane pyrophosphatase
MAGAFVSDALCSGAAGFLGMSVALKANVRAAEATRGSLNAGFEVAYRAGAVLGLAMVGIPEDDPRNPAVIADNVGDVAGMGADIFDSYVASVGDTVGDPFKDTAGPSINTLTTVMSLVASLFAPLIAVYHL